MPKFSPHVSRSLKEYIVLPGKITDECGADNVNLGCQLREDMYMPLAMFSAAMQCVTDDKLSIELAKYGGCGVLPRSLPLETILEMGKRIKRERSGFVYDVITVKPDAYIQDVEDFRMKTGRSTFPVVDDDGKLMGLITEKKYHPSLDLDKHVYERMIRRDKLVTGDDGISLEQANQMLSESGIGILPIVDKEDHFKCAVFWQDVRTHYDFPNAFVDDQKRYRYAVALGTFPEDVDRARAVVKNGADILVVDTSQAKSVFVERIVPKLRDVSREELQARYEVFEAEYSRKALEGVKDIRDLGVPIVVGNIVDEEGFNVCVKAGADAVKVGQGPGAGCTTRVVKREGRGQATAVDRADYARREYEKGGRRIPIFADGGIENTGDMGIAFALGADGLMFGRYFCRARESAAPIVKKRVTVTIPGSTTQMSTFLRFKEYWGEASARAMNLQRYGHRDSKTFIVEGEEGLVPLAGSIHDFLPSDINTLRGLIGSCGCTDIPGFQQKVLEEELLELQSEASIAEGRPSILVI